MNTINLPSPFHLAPHSLKRFIVLEKSHLYEASTTREFQSNGIIQGVRYWPPSFDPVYSTDKMEVISLTGVWVPAHLSLHHNVCPANFPIPLERHTPEGTEHLFIIHPASTCFFNTLIQQYHANAFEIKALTLSSTRTLLAAFETKPDDFEYFMVKLSFEKELGGRCRSLKLKESLGSFGNSYLLDKIQIPHIGFIQDSAVTYLEDIGRGTLFRPIPEVMQRGHSTLMPFYALFGERNSQILDAFLQHSQHSNSEFIIERLLRPLANIVVELIYGFNISIQLHAQNLLLNVEENTYALSESTPFYYRDMGGVNCLYSQEKKMEMGMPSSLTSDDLYYLDTHIRDAAHAIENHLVTNLIYNLTKQFVKRKSLHQSDPNFLKWMEEAVNEKTIGNWTLPGQSNDMHQESLAEDSFVRYGYFELEFAKILLEVLREKRVFKAIANAFPYTANYYAFSKKTLSSVSKHGWFHHLIHSTYSHYLKRM